VITPNEPRTIPRNRRQNLHSILQAKGTYKPGSDIDLTLLGEDLSQALLSQILDEIDDLFLPYMMDLSIFDTLNHEQLQSHIRRVGLVFYDKTQQTSG
jgi:uncharacterized protein